MKIKGKWSKLEIEYFVYPVLIAIFSLFLGANLIGTSFERNITYLKSFNYGNGVREKMTVINFDDGFIDDLKQIKFLGYDYFDWPLTYKTQAAIYNRILKYHPKAIFIDLAYYNQRRSDVELSYLSEDFLNNAKDQGVPVFLASQQFTEFNQDADVTKIRLPLKEFEQNSTPVLVGWDSTADNQVGRYPLQVDINGVSYKSAAFALYQTICAPNCPISADSKESLALQWADRDTNYLVYTSDSSAGCHKTDRTFFGELFSMVGDKLNFLHKWHENKIFCPPVDTLHPSTLVMPNARERNKELKEMIEGRVILIGASALGAEDLTITPTHGMQPGVYKHAMALDNLLNFGGNYPRDPVFYSKINLSVPITIESIVLLISIFYRHKLFSTYDIDLTEVSSVSAQQLTDKTEDYFLANKERNEQKLTAIEGQIAIAAGLMFIAGLSVMRIIYPNMDLIGLFVIFLSFLSVVISLVPKLIKKIGISVLHYFTWLPTLIFSSIIKKIKS